MPLRVKRRVPRILLDTATVASLVLCVAALVGWGRSYGSRFGWELYWGPWGSVTATRAYLMVNRFLPDGPDQREHDWGWYVPYVGGYRHFWARRGEQWVTAGVSLPVAASIAAVLPLARFGPPLVRRMRRRRHRRQQGHCPSCGYDLRATPDRCPECGLRTDQP
jgi:hypothetical protein